MLKVACTLMQRNEDDLLEPWIKYHGAMFGLENLHIIDNGSTNAKTLEILSRYEAEGVNVERRYSDREDYTRKGEIIGELVLRLEREDPCDFYILLDCDEFVCLDLQDHHYTSDKDAVHEYLSGFVGERRVCKVTLNLPNILGTECGFWEAGHSKVIFPRGTFSSTDHGHHTGISRLAHGYRPISLTYLHFHYRPFEDIVQFSRAKLEATPEPPDMDDPVALRAYRGQGWHLVKYLVDGSESYYGTFKNPRNIVRLPWVTEHFASLGLEVPFAHVKLPELTDLTRSPIEIRVDEVSPKTVRGWVVNTESAQEPVTIKPTVNGKVLSEIVCDGERPDVLNAGWPSSKVGFSFRLSKEYFNSERHTLQFLTPTGLFARLVSAFGETTEYAFNGQWTPDFKSSVDGMHEGVVKGWVLREADDGNWVGGCFVHVTCDGSHVAHIRADRHRGDVGKSHAADANCGFEFTAPMAFRKAHPQAFRFVIAPYNVEMAGSPLVTSFISDQNQAGLIDLNDTMDRLYVEMTRLRRKLHQMLPNPAFNLSTYDAWARTYQESLAARVRSERQARRFDQTLVSVICPTYRPRLADFTAAIESVIAQTHSNWELLIIDDGSDDPILTAQIEAYVKRDGRIRALTHSNNAGISTSTNTGLHAARGDWISFFDHDDLLVPVALEVMLTHARESKARMVYSDEDKIDMAGYFSEPAFKTDWNYRLLLGCNYICHLVMIDRSTLERVGDLNTTYNGAQDHDFLLRVSEKLSPKEIVHVPEVLYHWRKSETSTASSTGAKQYAVDAGLNAVSDHLRRRGKVAQVTSFNDSTWYKVRWLVEKEPSITIIVPFKEEIAVTRHCVDCILKNTAYQNFDVILVDNWSTSTESQDFTEEMNALPTVQVLRVEEDFNYSRINNLAARQSGSEYYVLMNNDLFVTDMDWLRTIVNEALVDDQVGIVGGKFVYPNRMVQHAGVVLGVGGVATHAHMGIGENDPGYAARALFAQELSAVTAACLLVRSSLFWQVGGLDEDKLAVAFNDVDLCLKIRLAGYKVIWTPEFLAEHHESLSRGADDTNPIKESRFFHEMQTMIERYGILLQTDPYYSKHFSLEMRPFYDLRNHAQNESEQQSRDMTIELNSAPPEQQLKKRASRAPSSQTGLPDRSGTSYQTSKLTARPKPV